MSDRLSAHRITQLAVEYLGTTARPFADVTAMILDSTSDSFHDEDSVLAELLDTGEFSETADDRILHLPTMLDGTTWACLVTAEDAETNSLPTEAFSHIGLLAMERPLTIVDENDEPTGGVIVWDEVEMDDLNDEWVEDRFIGPDGWLDAAVGGAITLTFGPECTVTVTHLDAAPPSTPELDEAFLTSYDASARADPDTPALKHASTDDVLVHVLADHRDLLLDVMVPPIDEFAQVNDLATHAHLIAPVGFDWDALDAQFERRRRRLGWQLSEHAGAALDLLVSIALDHADGVDVLRHGDGSTDDALATEMSNALDLPRVARAFCGEFVEGGGSPAGVIEFVEEVLTLADPPAGGAAFAAATLRNQNGEPLVALAHLEAVERSGTKHPDALEMLAGFRADQGDAKSAMALLRRAGVLHDGVDPDELEAHHLFMEIVDFDLNRPPAMAGRNDPCPCGSGKKYKKCHLGSERHALSDRAVWLYSKAHRFVRDTRFRVLAAELAREMTDAAQGQMDDFFEFVDSPLVIDLVLAEGGAGAAFAAERDALLPDDEALIAAQWALAERSIFEVEATTDTTLDLLDLRSGDRLTIRNTSPSDTTRRGTLLLGRAFPVADTWRGFAGFIPIHEHRLEAMMSALDRADPRELAHVIGRTFAPPAPTNTSGEPMRMHTMAWTVPPSSDVSSGLVAGGCRDDGDGTFVLVRDTNQANTVIANFTLDGSTLTVDCNSDQRAEEVTVLVSRHLPEAELADHDVIDSREMMRRARDAADGGGSGGGAAGGSAAPDLSDPEIRELMTQLMAERERAWLDESIPALDGMTPRACVDDPIAREKLDRLLARLPHTDDPTQMSASRLRAALGM